MIYELVKFFYGENLAGFIMVYLKILFIISIVFGMLAAIFVALWINKIPRKSKNTKDLLNEYKYEIEPVIKDFILYFNSFAKKGRVKYKQFDIKVKSDFILKYIKFFSYFDKLYLSYLKGVINKNSFLKEMADTIVHLKEFYYESLITKIMP